MKALEDTRREGTIGGSLEAKVVFQTASDRDHKYLHELETILPAVFIVSQVAVEKIKEVQEGLGQSFPKTQILIQKAEGEKCGRCWNYSLMVGQDNEHPGLCDRCSAAVRKAGSQDTIEQS